MCVPSLTELLTANFEGVKTDFLQYVTENGF